jgi:hypothetical protein
MTIADYMDVGWAYFLRMTPMMANPFEFRESLWAILHGDDVPKKPTPTATGKGAKSEQRALPAARRRAPSPKEWNKLAEFTKRIDAIKQKRQT